jgi:hypothetical protein
MLQENNHPDLPRSEIQVNGSPLSARVRGGQGRNDSLKWTDDGELSHVDMIEILSRLRAADDQCFSNNCSDLI